MRILNFGSLNIDYTYSVPHIVREGETISSLRLDVFPGGKGLNQSVALARAGAKSFHAGMVGDDGEMLITTLIENGVDTSFIKHAKVRSGNAIIQVSAEGENSIVLYGGANQANTKQYVDEVLERFGSGDWILLQNEVNLLEYIIERASERHIQIALNPSPFNQKIQDCDLSKVDLFLINEIEGKQITGKDDADEIILEMHRRFPEAAVVLTLGGKGSVFSTNDARIVQKAFSVKAVDTTAAGDTFTGYFIWNYLGKHMTAAQALEIASKAAAISVTRQGAVPSIPGLQEVLDYVF